jgi:hypothetical protein
MSLTDDDPSMDRQQSDPAEVPIVGALKAWVNALSFISD